MNNLIQPHALADRLLLDIAKRIQLTPTDYRIAVNHYEAINDYLERPGSALRYHVARLYPQGSMAIGAAIASKLRNDEFDIDVIVELRATTEVSPSAVLDALFNSVNGERGTRYFGKVTRRTRCVTIDYDRMHLDLTPAVLLPNQLERTSLIFHAHEDEPSSKHKKIVANPWGFANWFKHKTPAAVLATDSLLKAMSDPVPDQEDLNEKSLPLVALQLIKRWRNKCFDKREGRVPPSIVIAYFVAHLTKHRMTLVEELFSQAKMLLDIFQSCCASGEKITVINPTCQSDVLTDRWPATLSDQIVFKNDLQHLADQLIVLQQGPSVADCKRIMSDLFGENPTSAVVDEFERAFSLQAHAGQLHHYAGTAGLSLAASGLSSGPAAGNTYLTPKHTNFGGDGRT